MLIPKKNNNRQSLLEKHIGRWEKRTVSFEPALISKYRSPETVINLGLLMYLCRNVLNRKSYPGFSRNLILVDLTNFLFKQLYHGTLATYQITIKLKET